MELEQKRKIAVNLFNKVKKGLTETKKWNKENNNPYTRRPQFVELGYECIETSSFNTSNGTYGRGSKSYNIVFEGKTIASGIESYNEVGSIFSLLIDLLNKQKEVKGWSGLVFDIEVERKGYGGSNWVVPTIRIVNKVTLADAPCKEYKSLMNYLNKYGLKKVEGQWGYTKLNLGNYRLFSAQMGGKRGTLWDEYGERRFLDCKAKKCAEILATLRKYRGAKDLMICQFGEEDWMDDEERRYSSYHEVECEGEKRRYLRISIKTPQGKQKCELKIY